MLFCIGKIRKVPVSKTPPTKDSNWWKYQFIWEERAWDKNATEMVLAWNNHLGKCSFRFSHQGTQWPLELWEKGGYAMYWIGRRTWQCCSHNWFCRLAKCKSYRVTDLHHKFRKLLRPANVWQNNKNPNFSEDPWMLEMAGPLQIFQGKL